MNVKEGHPGAVFHWFFDTDQGTQRPAELLMMLHGTNDAVMKLTKTCLEKQSEFDDVLGSEILFLFFDTELSAKELNDHAFTIRHQFQDKKPTRKYQPQNRQSANYLFAGYGEAYPLPTGLVEIGKKRFRSEMPGQAYFSKIASQVAVSNGRAVPFFQQIFKLELRQNYLLIAHRKQRIIQTFELGESISILPENLLLLVRGLREIACNLRGPEDLNNIEIMTIAQLNLGRMRSAAHLLWNTIRSIIHSAT